MISDLRLSVPQHQEGYRLDRFLRESLPSVQGRSVRLAIEGGDVSVAGRKGAKGNIVHAADLVVVRRLAEPSDWLPLPGDVSGAGVIYLDSSIAVLDKPAGVQTEPLTVNEPGTMAGYFCWRFPETLPWSAPSGPLLSRLDRETSGVILGALTETGFRYLLHERQTGGIAKRYVCRVAGRIQYPDTFKWTIESRGGARVKVRNDMPDPQADYWTRIVPISFDGSRTVLSVGISKGKRHQIRAHLAAAGHPIIGDRIYGEGGAERLMLHAAEVTFPHPDTGKKMTISSSIPVDFGGY